MNLRGWFWCLFATFIIALGVGGTGMLIYSANSDQSFGVEPDYYNKALAWNVTAAQRETNTRLGWTIELKPGAAQDVLSGVVADASGVAIIGAEISGEVFANARSVARMPIATVTDASGRFQFGVPDELHGSLHVRLRLARGGETFTWEGDVAHSATGPSGGER